MLYAALPIEWTLLLSLQLAFTVWMLIDASRRGVESSWYPFVLLVQPFGAWSYFFVHKIKDYPKASRWLSDLFRWRPSLEELRHRLNQSATPANALALAERLVEVEDYAEAVPHLETVLRREPEHCRALFLLALSRRGLGHPREAVAPLEKLVSHHPAWMDYRAWRVLIAVCQESGDDAGALERCRGLVRAAPIMEHKWLLAVHLVKAGEKAEARQLVERALEDYRYLTGMSRRRDGRWVGKARQILKEIS
jgi:hypothetical protein